MHAVVRVQSEIDGQAGRRERYNALGSGSRCGVESDKPACHSALFYTPARMTLALTIPAQGHDIHSVYSSSSGSVRPLPVLFIRFRVSERSVHVSGRSSPISSTESIPFTGSRSFSPRVPLLSLTLAGAIVLSRTVGDYCSFTDRGRLLFFHRPWERR